MPSQPLAVERRGRSVVVHLHGDLIVPTAGRLYAQLRGVASRRNVATLVLDFAAVERIDSSGSAVVALIGRQLAQRGKVLDLVALREQHRATLALVEANQAAAVGSGPVGPAAPATDTPAAPATASAAATRAVAEAASQAAARAAIERMGARVNGAGRGFVALARLVAETAHQLARVAVRRARLPAGDIRRHIEAMGVEALPIVAMMSFLIGMTMAFQGAVQLQRFGAGVFVADMIGVSMVRELAPLMTAVIVTGRTGAAIAAELGTMQVRSELDALTAMGVAPVRFLIAPRIAAISLAGPALTLFGIFVGIGGGMMVAKLVVGMPAGVFWARVVESVTLGDFAHGLGKSLVFAWIIGFAGSHLGLGAGRDAGSVGSATTRTVVASIFLIVVVDAIFATVSTLSGSS